MGFMGNRRGKKIQSVQFSITLATTKARDDYLKVKGTDFLHSSTGEMSSSAARAELPYCPLWPKRESACSKSQINKRSKDSPVCGL